MDILKKIELLEHEATDFGFHWETTDQIMTQIQSECTEVQEHLHQINIQKTRPALQEEIGDLLHAVFSLCVFCQFNSKETLEKTTQKFQKRLHAVKQLANANGLTDLNGCPFDELMQFWDQAKKQVG